MLQNVAARKLLIQTLTGLLTDHRLQEVGKKNKTLEQVKKIKKKYRRATSRENV